MQPLKNTGNQGDKGASIPFKEHTQTSLAIEIQHAPHFAQQHKSAHRNVHFQLVIYTYTICSIYMTYTYIYELSEMRQRIGDF